MSYIIISHQHHFLRSTLGQWSLTYNVFTRVCLLAE